MFINLCSAQKKLNSETVQSKLVSSSLLLLPGGAAFSIFARKTSIVSESHAEVNSSNLAGMKHLLCSYTRSNRRGGEVRFPREERRAAPNSPFGCRWGLALIARRNVCDSSHTFAPKFGDVWRGYLRKSSPFTSFLLTFGKLTSKFELLSQFRKVENRRPSVAAYGKAVPSRPFHLRSVSWR